MQGRTRLAGRLAAAGLLAASIGAGRPAFAAELKPETVEAWNAYVAATEARIALELREHRRFLVQDFEPASDEARARIFAGDVLVTDMDTLDARGEQISVPSGMIHHWRGVIFVPGVTLDQLLARLQHPKETGPHQEDVLALRVLASEPNHLRLFIKMTRTKIVTVTYNTEHDVRYQRYGALRASSRSVATKIAELEEANTAAEREKPVGQDRGFLWRMNSYWRYEQVNGGVIVELESLTLSRDIPWGIKTMVSPIVNRIARQSMSRTLENLQRTYAAPPAERP
jgi:hypothetical protein